jgi:hypothetical protein
MADNVLPFLKPGTQPGVKAETKRILTNLDETSEEVSVESTDTPKEEYDFLSWVSVEVLDFTEYAKDLVEVAENQGEDAFWVLVAKLQHQINGWSPDGQH